MSHQSVNQKINVDVMLRLLIFGLQYEIQSLILTINDVGYFSIT